MSLPYFPMFPGDFEAKTSHLTLIEDGAYNRLLRICWMTPGCSIPNDEAWIIRRVRATTPEEQEAVRTVLAEFFTVSGGRLSNARLRKEWLAAHEAHERRKSSGAKGGKAKALKTKDTVPSNAVAKPKQPEPEPEPEPEEEDTEAKASDAAAPSQQDEPEDFAKQLFDRGVAFLGRHAVSPRNARSLIGQWRKNGIPDKDIFEAFAACAKAGAVEPVAWITARLSKPPDVDMDAIWKSVAEGTARQ